jgi:hypothetical protein
MSVAKRIANVEPIQADWLTIEDEDSLVHRYAKRGLADIKTLTHIECFCIPQKGSQAELVRDRDGKTTLRQDEPGLPAKIGVNYAELQANAGAPMRATWRDRFEYELED